MSKMTVAVAQTLCTGDVQANYEKAERMIAEAAQKGAQLIVFPENMNYVGAADPTKEEAVPDGEGCRRMAAAAKKYSMWVNLGSIKERTDTTPYNTSVLFTPEGEVQATYRKIHLCDMQGDPSSKPTRESDHVRKGNEIVVTDIGTCKVGMSICYDMRFPEQFRIMSEKGAQLILHPSCFSMVTGSAHWEILLRSIAVTCHSFVLACNHCGKKPGGSALWGHSMIIDPWGNIIAQAGWEKEALLVAEIDLDLCDEMRNRLGCMPNRRTDLYRLEEL